MANKKECKSKVIITHRGWQGHYCCQCNFHLNTLLDLDGFKIVVSTVGKKTDGGAITKIAGNRYFETMAFESDYNPYDDTDILKGISFDSKWAWNKKCSEREASAGHAKTIDEIKKGMLSGRYVCKKLT